MTRDSPTATVTVRGDRTILLSNTPTVREKYGWESRRFTIHCHTGRIVTGRWAGVPLGPVIEAAGFPDDTTHVLATGGDGHRACIEIGPTLDGLVGFVCAEIDRGHDDEFDDDWQDTPRLLAPDIDSARTVRDVVAITALSLTSGEDPETYEAIT
ncbi:Periplasmic DMSO/TMAO reductase YedYZ, molybdopterin-dependent catalytic subunit [Halalkaliarchaeum sp. AArc-CO]|uniref:hypothetical protein n=1 Tax=unclassified Halalkaliarchaeum TaxID=2678344 RepID=UPI00217E11A4|nr:MULTISPECIES: hypothetical protein [unclassified Halalkaliarchaeum]MDR5673176.1 hypothetical protein [Halalkaliarchaeum sp. AArc-GB]UWG51869.1 Periplasmic DMSO/TMAO reductase YedYZ, molybdopterin-dependent catalytic subunit [Halalkaliarchaeum sp. AArc-CO]